MVVDPAGADPGFFSARTLGIDELDCPGIFKMHLRALTSRFRQW
jgi:hypothetical protein